MTFSDPSSNIDTEMVNVSSEQAFADVAPPVGETPPQVLARQAAEGRRGAAWRLMYWVVDDDPRAILAISTLDDDRLAAHLLEFIALGIWAGKSFVVPRQIRSAHARMRLRTLFLPGAGMEMALAQRVLQKGTYDKRAQVREAALHILGMGGFPGIAPILVEKLEDPVPAVRLQAARALGHAGDLSALPALIKALHNADEQLSGQIFHALVHLGSAAVPALIKESESASPWIRWHCMRALGEICDDRAALQRIEDPRSRRRGDPSLDRELPHSGGLPSRQRLQQRVLRERQPVFPDLRVCAACPPHRLGETVESEQEAIS